MNARMLYEIRGWAYWAKCLNPWRNTITIRDLPLGLRLRAYKRDAVGRGLYRRKVHEPRLTELLLERFSNCPGKKFIDAGANIGYFSCLLARLAGPAGHVLAIEPEPQNLALLRKNIEINELTNVTVHPCAVGEKTGGALLGLYKPSNRGRHSILEKNARARIEVPVRTLDDIVRTSGKNVSTWSLLKIDVEGYEAFVIDGAKETLARVESLVMEFSPAILRNAGRDPSSTFKILGGYFSRVHRIGGEGLVQISPEDCLRSDDQVELLFER